MLIRETSCWMGSQTRKQLLGNKLQSKLILVSTVAKVRKRKHYSIAGANLRLGSGKLSVTLTQSLRLQYMLNGWAVKDTFLKHSRKANISTKTRRF